MRNDDNQQPRRPTNFSRVPAETRKAIMQDLQQNYEVNVDGVLSIKRGTIKILSKQYAVNRNTISNMWKNERERKVHNNMNDNGTTSTNQALVGGIIKRLIESEKVVKKLKKVSNLACNTTKH